MEASSFLKKKDTWAYGFGLTTVSWDMIQFKTLELYTESVNVDAHWPEALRREQVVVQEEQLESWLKSNEVYKNRTFAQFYMGYMGVYMGNIGLSFCVAYVQHLLAHGGSLGSQDRSPDLGIETSMDFIAQKTKKKIHDFVEYSKKKWSWGLK